MMKTVTTFPNLRAKLFISIARWSSRLPAIRGRTRVFLLLHHALGLAHTRLLVSARLSKPVAFDAQLDMQSWLQRIAFLTGEYESDTVQFLYRLWRSSGSEGYLLDVGANVGMISIPFALMCKPVSGKRPIVVAIEATHDNASALATNIRINDLIADIAIVETALGDEEKTVRIQVEGDLALGEGSGTANILPDQSTFNCVSQSLRLATLDGLLRNGELVGICSVIKIDTDGYDLKVLEGGSRFLAEFRPVIFGEFSAHCMKWHNQSISDVMKFAERNDYSVFFRRAQSLSFAKEEPSEGYIQDLLLIPGEKSAAFTWCVEGT